MNVKQLKLFNFWSHKDTTINFDKSSYMILGKLKDSTKSNGSGKSTIARGIAYALYGDASDEIKNDDAIYNDAKNMGVMLTFELNDIDYVVKRKLVRGSSPSIHIKQGIGQEVKYGVKAGQEMINAILGADFAIFKNTSYFRQGDINSFAKLTPKEAKEVVIKILQLDIYNHYEKMAKDKVKELDIRCSNITTSTSSLESQLIEEEKLNKDKPKVDTTELTKLEKDLSTAKKKQLDVQTLIDGKNATLEEVNKKEWKITSLKDKAEFKYKELSNRIEKLQGLTGTCPTCECILNEDIKKATILRIKKEQMPLSAEIETYFQELDKVQIEKTETNNIEVDTHNYSGDISSIATRIGEMNAQLKQQIADVEKIKKLEAEIDKLNITFKNTNDEKDRYDILTQAFGKKGIQAYIIENVIPEIQATTNDILTGLDTTIRINIDSQKELKKGGRAETLNINVITPYGERPYTNYSGGEKTFIDFALRIALSIILTRRSECKIQTLILDEVFGELDTVNKRIISKALRFIAERFDFKKILIISHAEELQDSFENIIRVEFDGEKSIIKENKNEKSK